MAGKQITLDKEGISEILVADTDSESGSEASDFENDSEEEEKEDQQHHHHHHQQLQHNNKPQQISKHRLQQVLDYQPGDRLKEET